MDLTNHFGLDKTDANAISKAASILKKNARVIKSDYGELKVKVRDVDRDVAANVANAIMEKLQQMHQDIQTANNSVMLLKINEEYLKRKIDYEKLVDSLQHVGDASGTSETTCGSLGPNDALCPRISELQAGC